jgi:hypothetical protein
VLVVLDVVSVVVVPLDVSGGGVVVSPALVIAALVSGAVVEVSLLDPPQAARPSMHTAAVAAIRDFNIRCS